MLTQRKKILLGLLVLAMGIMAAGIIWPGVNLEYGFYIISVPVIVMNMWEWFDHEFMDTVMEIVWKKPVE